MIQYIVEWGELDLLGDRGAAAVNTTLEGGDTVIRTLSFSSTIPYKNEAPSFEIRVMSHLSRGVPITLVVAWRARYRFPAPIDHLQRICYV